MWAQAVALYRECKGTFTRAGRFHAPCQYAHSFQSSASCHAFLSSDPSSSLFPLVTASCALDWMLPLCLLLTPCSCPFPVCSVAGQ